MSKNIVLLGFMGAGKSLASNELAKRFNRQAISTDDLIEKEENRAIAQIFEESGEAYFRDKEKRIVRELVTQEDLIIDCGGGIFLDQENIDLLKENGVTIYLYTSAGVIFERTKGLTHRPLLNVDNPKEKITQLLKEREPFYKQAEFEIDTDGKVNDQVCDEIEEILKRADGN